jgi:hypothetical protein
MGVENYSAVVLHVIYAKEYLTLIIEVKQKFLDVNTVFTRI